MPSARPRAGTPIGDLCRQLGVAEPTFYAWKKKYAHLGVSELRRLRQLEEENSPTEAAGGGSLARQAHAVGGAAKKSLRPARRRELAQWFHGTFQVSCARACRLAQFGRAVVVSNEPGEGSIGAAAPHSGSGACPTSVWVSCGSGCCSGGRAGW